MAKLNLNFSFFEYLRSFYEEHKKLIRQNYRDLTKKFLDYNDETINPDAFLRCPQFEALEIYVFMKEFFGNKSMQQLAYEWHYKEEGFSEKDNWITKSDVRGQISWYDMTDEEYQLFEDELAKYKTTYPNYIFALTMGLGKTILMATCIFYEFLLAKKWPNDKKYCHNAVVFAPDKTVLQSLREIQDMDKSLVVPKEYVNSLEAELKFHFLGDTSTILSTQDGSDFNVIISNNQKFIAKQKHKEATAAESLFQSTQNDSDNFFSNILGDVLGNPEIVNANNVEINHRFSKLARLPQIGVFIDEAHHLYGKDLMDSIGDNKSKKTSSLRYTVNLLDGFLREQGTHVVACYNYTGTPYVQNQTFPEVVYAYGLSDSIQKGYLKRADILGYKEVREEGFLTDAITKFWNKYSKNTYEGLKPKMAIFGSNIKEVNNVILPEIEKALNKLGIPLDTMLVNTEQSSNEDIRDFNNLDVPGTAGSQKQFIILVQKGREGWNCRSLFSVAMHRRPGKKVFVLQSTMRCLRSITAEQQTATIFLSEENMKILNEELADNYRTNIEELSKKSDHEYYHIHVNPPEHKVELKRVHSVYTLIERDMTEPVNFNLLARAEEMKDRWGQEIIEKKLASLSSTEKRTEFVDETYTYEYSELTLVAEIARYLNFSPLEVQKIIKESEDGMEQVLLWANSFKQVVYEILIPMIFDYKYEINKSQITEDNEVTLLKIPKGEKNFYTFSGKPELVVEDSDKSLANYKDKSFHADTYVFDSKPERELFLQYLENDDVEEIYFTGMFTSKQGDFYIQYIDPEAHTVRSYYPDFVVKKKDGSHEIIEVKGDNKKDDPVVQAKKAATEEQAGQSGFTYRMILGSEIMNNDYTSNFAE
ncbi:MAG: TnsA endonuclease N-terminal domain-containing protein [Sporolactobacillus sp.]